LTCRRRTTFPNTFDRRAGTGPFCRAASWNSVSSPSPPPR
jgi:hypothetical protein